MHYDNSATILGRLLSNRRLRTAMQSDAQHLNVNLNDLERQAQSLIGKRLNEVRRLMPVSFQSIEHANDHFQTYAETFWPTTHHRHHIDAVRFCEYLESRGVRGVNEAERNVLRFRLGKHRLQLRVVPDLWIRARKRWALQILYRVRQNVPRQLAVFMWKR